MHPLKTFIIYSSKDKQYREELENHLQILIDDGLLELWSDKQILPGEAWDAVIKKKLNESELILLLVSIDFFNSEYIRNEEFKIALQRLNDGAAIIVPVIVRPCLWNRIPVVKDLQVLPTGGNAVSDEDAWKNRDKAWHNVVARLADMIDAKLKPQQALPPTPPQPEVKKPAVVIPQAKPYELLKEFKAEKLPMPKGIYSFFEPSPSGDHLYAFKHREEIDFGQHYDLVYFDIRQNQFQNLGNTGTANYDLIFLNNVLISSASVVDYKSYKVLTYGSGLQLVLPYSGMVANSIFTDGEKLYLEMDGGNYYYDEFGKKRKAPFLTDFGLEYPCRARHGDRQENRFMIVSQENKSVKSKYESKWDHPKNFFLIELDDDLNILKKKTILSETNTEKYSGFVEWGRNRILFCAETDENGDGIVNYKDRDNYRLFSLQLDTHEISEIMPRKFSNRAVYGLPNDLIFFVDEITEDKLYYAMIYDASQKQLSKIFEMSGGSFSTFRFTKDYDTLFFKKVLPSAKKETFYDWENDSEFYRMPFARIS